MNTNNGFVSLKGMDIPNPTESKRQRYVWVTRIFPRKIKWTIISVICFLVMVGGYYCAVINATKKPQPILWVDASEVVQSVQLSDGTIISNQDPRVWNYMNRGYETRYKSR